MSSLGLGLGLGRVVCGMSGGVDSAVAAALLKLKGFDVIGVYMSNWDEQDESGICQLQRETDLSDAKEACDHLRIPFRTVSFVKEYWNDVFTSLLSDYEAGLTPNPDVLCNRYLKFGAFYKHAREQLQADFIATGHYARNTLDLNNKFNTNVRLKRALDLGKDQTLFLSCIEQVALQRTLFPLGSLYKSEVRRIAKDLGLHNLAKKRDSVGICFIGDRTFSKFISDYIKNKPGLFVDVDNGTVVGEHQGVHQFTIGQRCRLSGRREAYYVLERDAKSQLIYCGKGRDHPALYSGSLIAQNPHWICDLPDLSEDKGFYCMFKFQHSEWTIPAQVFRIRQSDLIRITLAIDTRAVTPGQQAVFYKGDVCLGSAKIVWMDALDRLGICGGPSSPVEAGFSIAKAVNV